MFQRMLARISYYLPGGDSLRPLVHKLRGVHLGHSVWISQFVYIDEIHPSAITIGDQCTIGLKTSIIAHLYWGKYRPDGAGPVTIENDVFVGPHVLILPNVRIGEGSVIQGGSVVSRNVPAHTLWGPPAAGPIGRVTVPLTRRNSHEEFIGGIRPFRHTQTKGE